jgi:hypothetical protein
VSVVANGHHALLRGLLGMHKEAMELFLQAAKVTAVG